MLHVSDLRFTINTHIRIEVLFLNLHASSVHCGHLKLNKNIKQDDT